jgi:hypothetical protein
MVVLSGRQAVLEVHDDGVADLGADNRVFTQNMRLPNHARRWGGMSGVGCHPIILGERLAGALCLAAFHSRQPKGGECQPGGHSPPKGAVFPAVPAQRTGG